MITKNINACLYCRTLIIGRQMENNYRQFIFDCTGFPVEVTSIMLVHQRSRDVAPYIAATSNTNTLTWTVSDTDTAYAGYGSAELRITFADGLAKSIVYQTNVIASITGDTVIPEPLQSWYDALIEYIDEHAASPEQIAEAVADYIETHPIDAPVQSVNGQTGTVVLTAADVGALADSVTIPTRVSQLTNDAGYITSAPVQSVNNKTGVIVLSASDVEALPDTTTAADIGGYVKPSAGIPKTDLSATVQASLDKADTALQTAPVTSVDGKTGAVQILPNGGSAGQVLAKASATDRDVEWITPSGGGSSSWTLFRHIDLTGINIVHLDELANYNEMLFAFYGVVVATKGNIWFMRGNVTGASPTSNRIMMSNSFFTTSNSYTMSRACLKYTDDGILVESWMHGENQNAGVQMYGFTQMNLYSPDGNYPPRRSAGEGITIVLESSAPTRGFLEVYVK